MQRLKDLEKEDFFYLLLIFLFLLSFINLVYLDLKVSNLLSFRSNSKVIYSPVAVNNPQVNQNICPQSCLTQIAQATASAAKPTPVPLIKTSVNQAEAAREYYIPFGSGSGNYSDWTDIPGLAAFVESTSYSNVKSITFEASLHIPTGNEIASVRLVNATDGRVIANSELNFNGNTDSVLLSSPQITLDYGQKLYKVQLKTQLQSTAVVDQSRIHITTY